MLNKSWFLFQFAMIVATISLSGCWNTGNSGNEKPSGNQEAQVSEGSENGNANSQSQQSQSGTTNGTPDETLENIDLSNLTRLFPRLDIDADTILADMVKTYKEATSYGDHGFVEIKYELPDRTLQTDTRKCLFAYIKPNKVRMEVHQGQLVSDGTLFTSQASGNSELYGQILEKRAPSQITIKDLYSDYLLAELMDLGVPPEVLFVPPQIVLLFAQDPLQTLVPADAEIKMGFPDYILTSDNQFACPCDKIEVIDKQTGRRTYWIERGTNILLRMEIDVTKIRDTEVKPVSIKIEFQDAMIDAEILSEAFLMEKPLGSTPVSELMLPKLAMLGKMPDGTICTSEDNEQVALASPTQRGVTVAAIFVTDPNATTVCRAALQTLQSVSERFASNQNVNCYPVAIDAETVPNREISEMLTSWGINLSFLRQPSRELMERLRLTDVPSFLIFGPNGHLQLIQSDLLATEDLASIVNSAMAGSDPYQNILAYYKEQKAGYHQSIDQFVSFDVFRTEPESVQIAEQTKPQTMMMSEIWRRTELVSPGNPLVVGRSLLIPHDFQKISVFGPDGQTMTRNEQNDPATIMPQGISADMPLHYIRNAAAPDTGQRYFAVTGINQRQFFVLDKDLNPVLTWPKPADEGKFEIAAVQMADLTGDGNPNIIIGYRVPLENSQRLAVINLAGTTIWEDRTVTEPDQIAIVWKNKVPHVWVVNRYNETNAFVEFDAKGQKLREWEVDTTGGLIWKLFAADLDGDGNSEVLAVLPRAGEIVIAGLNPNASLNPVLWEHPISPGSHGVKSFEFVTTGDINGDKIAEWCVAAADGTIYFFNKAGRLLDSFVSGELLSGMAIVPGDGTTSSDATLVLATSKDRYDTDLADDAVIALKLTQINAPPNVPAVSETVEPDATDDTGETEETAVAPEPLATDDDEE